jgi:L-aspartate oxidase
VPEDIRAIMPQVQPNFVLPFDRMGIDAYRDRFEVTLHAEGTVRGIGGLRVDQDCQTAVSGLYVAGDAASRELVTGAISGGGAVNSSWALSSGQWAGAAAARRARALGASRRRPGDRDGQAGLSPRRKAGDFDAAGAIQAVREELNAYDKNIFRRGEALTASLERLDGARVNYPIMARRRGGRRCALGGRRLGGGRTLEQGGPGPPRKPRMHRREDAGA